MEKLKLNLIQLNKALKTLQSSFNVIQQLKKTNNEEFILAAEDSTIQRFEYTYESFWKFLKKYLEQKHNLENINSPKKVFHACFKAKICTIEEGNIFADMADSRNETSHTYSIEGSRIILPIIPKYYSAMMSLVNRLNDELKK